MTDLKKLNQTNPNESTSSESSMVGYDECSPSMKSHSTETGLKRHPNWTKDDGESTPSGKSPHPNKIRSNSWMRRLPSKVDSSNPVVYMAVLDPEVESSGYNNFHGSNNAAFSAEKCGSSANAHNLNDSTEVVSESGEDSPTGSQGEELDDAMPKQHSIVTIFSIWNTMMGTSILAMPWALSQAGLGFGLFLIIAMAALACYTAYLTIRTTDDIRIIQNIPKSTYLDISDACQYHLGRPGRIIALVFSLISLLGASIVYYVLLTNFLYYTGEYIFQLVHKQPPVAPPIHGAPNNTDILCPAYSAPNATTASIADATFNRIWSKDRTVPAWLLLIVFPLISIKSPTCLGKFTALASMSVCYLFILIGIKGYKWGVIMTKPPLLDEVPQIRGFFPALTGTCSLALFIHNALHTILRAQRNPEHNVRDTAIAFGCTTLTYALMGLSLFIVFPVSKYCILDNFLNNLVTDIPVFVGRLGLLFQMSMVYPMLVYILRAQVLQAIFKDIYPSWRHVLVVHVIVVGFGLLFAIVYPQIGTIIRFIGAVCGLVFIFTIPTVITLMNKWKLGHLSVNPSMDQLSNEKSDHLLNDVIDEYKSSSSWVDRRTKMLWCVRCFFYTIIIILGVLNFIGQFVLLGYE